MEVKYKMDLREDLLETVGELIAVGVILFIAVLFFQLLLGSTVGDFSVAEVTLTNSTILEG